VPESPANYYDRMRKMLAGIVQKSPETYPLPELDLSRVTTGRLGPLLYYAAENGDLKLPEDIVEGLRPQFLESSARVTINDFCINALSVEFSRRNIQVVLLKGIYLQKVVYENPAVRLMEDIDVIIQPEHELSAAEALKALGYKEKKHGFRRFGPGISPASTWISSACAVDLHTSLTYLDHYTVSASVIWGDTQEINIGRSKSLVFSPELNFIIMGLHCLNHGGALRDWFDMAYLVSRKTPDWTKLAAWADKLGVQAPTAACLSELKANWSVKIPDDLIEELKAHKQGWLEKRVIRAKGVNFWRLLSRIKMLKNWKTRGRYLAAKFLERFSI
jgi:hypothetical protein